MYKIKNTELDFESRIFHLHKIFYSALSLVLMQPITPCSFPKLRSNIPCADCYLISINNQHYFLLIYLYLMTMKTSYRKIYLFLLLLTSYSCNDLTETNMSIDIISMTKYNNIINIDSSVSVSAILYSILKQKV